MSATKHTIVMFTRSIATKHGGSGSHSNRIINKRMIPFWVKKQRREHQVAWSENPRPLVYTRDMKEAGNVPFNIFRSDIGKQLPVYIDYKNGRSKTVTILRKYEGDVHALATEMQKVCLESEVKIYNGRIEAKGNHTKRVKSWLSDLGF